MSPASKSPTPSPKSSPNLTSDLSSPTKSRQPSYEYKHGYWLPKSADAPPAPPPPPPKPTVSRSNTRDRQQYRDQSQEGGHSHKRGRSHRSTRDRSLTRGVPQKSSPNSPKSQFPPLSHNSSSEPSTTLRSSSPLNSSASPERTTPLSSSPDTGVIDYRLRVDSTGSTTRSLSPPRADALSLTTSSLQRGRSLSPHRERAYTPSRRSNSRTPDPSESWRGNRELVARPWNELPRRKKTIPSEQSERWEITRRRVGSAAVSVLSTVADVAHELLDTGVGFLGFVPIPGLEPAARELLRIWDTLQQVDTNRLECLRLTERCADTLLSIHKEIQGAGKYVCTELQEPIMKLVEAFVHVHILMQKQVDRPFIKRYLKRDDILQSIQGCDTELNNALGMFILSIQIRILRQIQDSDRKRQAEMEALIARRQP